MKKLFQFLLCGLLALLFSCGEKDIRPGEDTTLFLRHKGANMPIWVKGNRASDKIVLFLHGGPGDCSMCYRYYLQDLEKDVMMAYWDQRVAGSSSGKVDPATLRYAQFGEDLELVVKLLRRQYPNARIYLLGHSFGVELAWQFLTTGTNQQQVAGAMMVNGMHSYYRWLYHVREWALREARRQNHTEAETYLLAHPVTPENTATIDWEGIYRWMYKLGGNPVSLYSDKKFVLDYAFDSPNTALAQFTHGKAYGYYGEVESRRFEKGPLLAGVRVPIGLFWGAKDGVVPLELSGETKALLTGTTVTSVTFHDSWHEPFVTETARFNAAVRDFVRGN
ncbi:alpha/beta fold hydrolase [Tellurirhabdus rosea]|uniref:alpha/beta fold hydrolase n=1 Tax=Tellurirhabdus rosea TaxID=2674997 RepID=UPI00224EDAD6|nr:alpha/beta hydrolase [Tellurirhabdus rosea]